MKRFLVITAVLLSGAALGAGGLYLGLNWDKVNPWREPDRKDYQGEFTTKLRKACTSEATLKGSTVKKADFANDQVFLHGFVTREEQKNAIADKARALLGEMPELQQRCGGGVSVVGLKLVPIPDRLATLLAVPLDDIPGVEAPAISDQLTREIIRTTRLDGYSYTEDGKLTFTGLCIRGNVKTDAMNDALKKLLKARLEALGVTPALMPEITLDVRYYPNPAVTLQKQLAGKEQAKDVRVTSAWFDAGGQLHVAGILGQDADRKHVDDALAAFVKDPQTAALASPGVGTHLVTFQPAARLLDLHKKLIEYARKENKPHLRRVRMDQVLPTALEDDKKKIVTDDEGNIVYFFRVKGVILETAGERAQIEKELTAWLIEQLPRVMNSDQKPIPPRLAFEAETSPIFRLQQRIVERGLDGAVITDALFDEKRQLELHGRVHQPDAAGRKAIEVALSDMIGAEVPWTLQTVQPHQSAADGQPVIWKDALSQMQARLGRSSSLGQRVRIDRLYFHYDKQQLRLAGAGVFLADTPIESPDAALRKAVDDVIATRGKADLRTAAIKTVKNPLTDLQNETAGRSTLDGVLLTGVRYGADGVLHVDGYLGQPDQKTAGTMMLSGRLEQMPDLLKATSDPKAAPAWSIDLKPHVFGDGDLKWPEVVRAWQGELAIAPEVILRRAHLGRAYFKYVDVKVTDPDAKPRRLILQCSATHLSLPSDGAESAVVKPRLELKLAAVGRRVLAKAPIDQASVDVATVMSPIFELQKQAVAKSFDGLLFKDAYYDKDGKLALDGLRGNAEQLKQARQLLDDMLAAKTKTPIAPSGLAALDGIKLIAWQPMLDDARKQFAQDKSTLLKQTRIDRAYFQYDKAQTRALLHFKGINIYQGKAQTAEQQAAAIADKLKQQLQGKDIAEFDIDVSEIARAVNPLLAMQALANERKLDGVVFSAIGFDAKGTCFIKMPFAVEGQEENVRKLIDEFAKKNPHLRAIQLQ